MISRPRRVRKSPQLARAAGRELCFVKDCPALMVLQSELEMLSRVDAGFNLFDESAEPDQRNMTYGLSVSDSLADLAFA